MVRVITVNSLPPEITASFDNKLLFNHPIFMKEPKYYRDLYEDLARKKYKPGSRKMREFESVMAVYEELYGWKVTEKAYQESQTKKIMERPVIPTKALNSLCGEMGTKLRSAFGL